VIYGFLFLKALGNTDTATIWVAKPLPTLPWQAPNKPTPADYKKTTIKAHERTLVQEAIQSLLFTACIALFMSIKFNIHPALVMQGVMLPLGLTDNRVFRKYIIGAKIAPDGEEGGVYGEIDYDPLTRASVTVAEKGFNKKTDDSNDGDAPRVEIISEESTSGDAKQRKRKAAAHKGSKTDINEVD